jgi:serine protease Do
MRLGVGFAVLVALAPVIAAPAGTTSGRDEADAFEKQLKAVIDTAGPAVACVVVSRSEHYPKPASPGAPGQLGGFDRKAYLELEPSAERERRVLKLDLSDPAAIPDNAYAGGVVLDPAGLILTPWHVIDGATKVYVHLPGGRGSYADIHAADSRTDLAVLKLLTPPPGLKAVRLGDAEAPRPRPGTFVILLTRPYTPAVRIEDASNAIGPLGNVLRRRPEGGSKADSPVYDVGDLFELPLRGAAGFSGGAVFSRDGVLVGLTSATAMVTGENGPGYALPVDAAARRVIDVLARGREVESGFLGIVYPNPPPRTGGLPIDRVVSQGPAAVAGLRVGDVIVRLNETVVDNQSDLHVALRYALAGTRARVTVRRGGQTREFDVVPGKSVHTRPFIASVQPDPVFGLRVDFNTPLLQQQDGVRPTAAVPQGVLVRELLPGSPAAARFKALGEPRGQWLVTHVDGAPTPTPAEFYTAAKGKKAVKLTVTDPLATGAAAKDVTLP